MDGVRQWSSLIILHVPVHFSLQTDNFCSLFHSATPHLLIGIFSSVTFKVIIDRYVHIAILSIVFWLFAVLCFFPFLLLSVIHLFSLVKCLDSLLFLCISFKFLFCGYHEANI